MVESENGKWNQRSNAPCANAGQIETMFRLLFENSADAILVVDPQKQSFVECNEAAVRMSRGGTREWLLSKTLIDLSPERQSDGKNSAEKLRDVITQTLVHGTQKFEWIARRFNGEPFPLEVVITPVQCEGETLLFTFTRDISERKKEETRIQRLNEDLEARVRERTIEIVEANERLKAEVKERRRKEKVQTALYQISEAIHTTEDLDSLFERIHRTIQELMDARNFYIALCDPATEMVHFPYFVDEIDARPAPLKLSSGLTSYVLRTGKALLVNRETPIQRLESGARVLVEDGSDFVYEETGTPSAVWLGAPLTTRCETFGVIAVQNYHNEQLYGDAEKQILTFVAEQIALAIERKKAEGALRQLNRELTALLETMPGYAFYKDKNGKYRLGNENLCQALGCTKEALVGKTDFELFPRESAEKFRADDLRLFASGQPLFVGEETIYFEGKPIFVETQKVPVKDDNGAVIGVIGVGFDITKRKQAEEELLKALARETELSQMKSNFVSTVSHEFRTPLGIIMSSSQILRDYFESLDPAERKEHLDSISKNTRRMGILMEEVLLLSRVDAGKTACQPAWIDLTCLIRSLREEILSSTEKENPISLDLPEKLEAQLDERLLRHILTNLLLNAVKYSSPESLVVVRASKEKNNLTLEIVDRGIGIPEADQQWLFNAFHRGRNVGERPGTGLGLTIVKRCVDLHGGSIHIKSAVGQGTTVQVRLPIS